MKSKLKRNAPSIFTYIAVIIILQSPMIFIDGRYDTFYQAYCRLKELGLSGVSDTAAELWSGDMLAIQIQLTVLACGQIIGIGYIITILCGRNLHLNIPVIVFLTVNSIFYPDAIGLVTDNDIGFILSALAMLLCFLEFLVPRVVSAWRASRAEAEAAARRSRQYQEEKKRRLYFPGNYTELFYQIVWKNFKYDWKDYVLLLVCSSLISTLSFAGIGCYQMLSGIHRESVLLLGQGLERILLGAMVPMGLCAVFLMAYMMIYYLKKWMERYSIFVTLGIRERALYIIIALEILFAFFVSVLVGILLGNGMLTLLRRLIGRILEVDISLITFNWKTYLLMPAEMLFLYMLSLMAGREMISDFHLIRAAARRVCRENMPSKKLNRIMAGAGAVLSAAAIALYSQLVRHECIYLLCAFFLGVFLLMRFGGAACLQNMRRTDRYYKGLMKHNHIYHKSRTTAWYLTVLSALYICGMFYYTFQVVSAVTAEEPETLFPYDFICISDEGDNDFFDRLEKEYELDILRVPMLRVSNADKTESSEGMELRPQGQQIGISETTFHQLKKLLDEAYEPAPLKLDENGEKVYIVHQQDRSVRAQPVDWAYGSSRPFLHIGLPCPQFSLLNPNTKSAYAQRTVVGEEIGSLTGCFRQGNLENIIVFSDEYFEKAQDIWKYTNMYDGSYIEDEADRIEGVTVVQGPTQLVLIRADTGDIKALEEEMGLLEARHEFEKSFDWEVRCWYSKEAAISDMRTERLMTISANSFVLLVLLMTGLFLIYVKSLSELEEKKERAVFLECMGMRRKERVYLLKQELYLFYKIPLLISAAAVPCFMAAVFHARMYPAAAMKRCISCAGYFWLGWVLAEGIFIWGLGRWMIRKVEGKHK